LPGHVTIVGSVTGGKRLAAQLTDSVAPGVFASVHAQMLLEGTRRYDKQSIQTRLDTIGATLSFGTTPDRLLWNLKVGVINVRSALDIVLDALVHPTFPQTELNRLLVRTASELSLEQQDTRTQALIQMTRAMYTPGHVLYDNTTVESHTALASITRDQLLAYHAQCINRDTVVLALAGDVKDTTIEMLDTYFKRLPVVTVPQIVTLPTQIPSHTYLTHTIPDKSSVDYMIGIPTGITDVHPDYPALLLGLQILGRGGFTGRLMQTVREQEGLTYGAYAYGAGFTIADGYICIRSSFAPDILEAGRASIRRQIDRILTDGVTASECSKHTFMYRASSQVGLIDSSSIARTAHDIVVRGKLLSFIDTFPETIAQLTKKQVDTALRKYIIFDHAVESVAGTLMN
jgi:zinc protease